MFVTEPRSIVVCPTVSNVSSTESSVAASVVGPGCNGSGSVLVVVASATGGVTEHVSHTEVKSVELAPPVDTVGVVAVVVVVDPEVVVDVFAPITMVVVGASSIRTDRLLPPAAA